jgi:hypothetical protein
MDDQALTPQAPQLDPQEVEEQAIDEAIVENKKYAQAVGHPAWEKVEEDILETIERMKIFPDPNLIAEEYKIDALGKTMVRNELTNLLDRIHNAVESTERNRGE